MRAGLWTVDIVDVVDLDQVDRVDSASPIVLADGRASMLTIKWGAAPSTSSTMSRSTMSRVHRPAIQRATSLLLGLCRSLV